MIEFFGHLNAIRPLSAEAQAALLKVIRAKELRRGQVWLQEGAVCDRMVFVLRGLMKLYFQEGDRDVILYFACNNDWIISAQSYFDQLPSKYTIRSVEQSVVVYMPRDEILSLLIKYPELNIHLYRICQMQAAALEYHTGLLLMPPKERFEKFSQSSLSAELNDKLIAGYLGVSQNSICNWRKDHN